MKKGRYSPFVVWQSRTHRMRLGRIVLVLILGALFTLVSVGEFTAQRNDQRELQNQFDGQLTIAARFLNAYVTAELRHEQSLAESRLAGPSVTQSQFESFAEDLQFGPSLLINSSGQVLDVTPQTPRLIGFDIAPEYPHLIVALAGRRNVSQVVPSAAQHVPVVAFAVPFPTPQGRRVMSGTLQISSGPLGDYLQSVRSISGSVVRLVDDGNNVIASAPRSSSMTHLGPTFPSLAPTSQTTVSGKYYASVAIRGTPWKIIATVPTSALYQPIDGSTRAILWSILLGFALVAIALGVVILRSWERRLLQAEEAGYDALTGLANRRQFDERTAMLYSSSRRHHVDVAVLMIDIDNFKDVNDRFGHQVGDRVLKVVADCVRTCLRSEDVGARWGGEEFAIVLPFTGLDGATNLAERLRNMIALSAIDVGGSETLTATVSIGVAAEVDGVDPDGLLQLADVALYWAKERGRNCVVQYALPSSPAEV
jgi:diguanylate cyclase (GGDEF)-like protein